MLFILLCTLFFINYLQRNKIHNLFVSLLFFTLSLFTRESTIIFPATLGLLTLALHQTYNPHLSLFKSFTFSFSKTYLFGLIGVAFLSLRLWLYPFAANSCTNSNSLITKLIKKIPELKVFIYDFFALSWLPWDYPILRSLIIVIMISISSLLLIKNKNKLLTASFFIGGFLLLWPGLVNAYNCRYFYEAYGFLLAGQLSLLTQSTISFPGSLKKIAVSTCTLLVSIYALFCFYNFSIRESKMIITKKAAYLLVNNPKITNRALCFVGHPLDGYADHFSQFFWLYFDNSTIPVYVDQTTAFVQADSNIFVSNNYYLSAAHRFKQNYVTILPVAGGFRLTSLNPRKMNFAQLNPHGTSLGKKIIHKIEIINGEKVVTDFTLLIDAKYLKNNPIFIKWDYDQQQFVLFDEKLIKETVYKN